jgi:two-component system response regulator PrrA
MAGTDAARISSMPTVLVVDDDRAIRAVLERSLALEGFEVVAVADGELALERVVQAPPDVVVLDVGLPGIDGVEVVRRIRADGNDVPICILSARVDVGDRIAGLEAGADDYMVKPFSVAELVARLNALLRRRPESEPTILIAGELRVDTARHQVRLAGFEVDLTRREFHLLETLTRNQGIVMSRERLLELVWGYDFEVNTNVVDVFVGYLRRKLEAAGEPRIIHTVRGVGFVLRP